MNSSEYSQLVGKRLKEAILIKGWTQTELLEECNALGLSISQSAISRMLSGLDKLDLYKTTVVCKALGLQIQKLLSFDPDEDVMANQIDNAFITDPRNDKLQGYLGDYKGYFYSTINMDDTIHCGDFKLYPDESASKCLVSFRFSTGKTDANNNPVYKEYVGTAKLSDKFSAICCEMTDKDGKGDVSYIIIRYDYIFNQQCECKIGMVVTICAGLKRLPVAHKLLICRQKLSEKDLYFISGQLKLNDDTILISESDYFDFANDPNLPEAFKSYVTRNNENGDRFTLKAAKQTFYTFREDAILESKSLSRSDKAKVINLLRKYSDSKRCKKVGPKSEAFIFDYLSGKETQQETDSQDE